MAGETTAQDVAEWMLSGLDWQTLLHQEFVVIQILLQFGEQFTYTNNNDNFTIAKNVLEAFRRLTGDDVFWVSDERYWRRRQPDDEPSRHQSY